MALVFFQANPAPKLVNVRMDWLFYLLLFFLGTIGLLLIGASRIFQHGTRSTEAAHDYGNSD